jgi:hypothetical protein
LRKPLTLTREGVVSDKRAKQFEHSSETEEMEIKVVGHAAPLRYPPLETVVARATDTKSETKQPPQGFGYPAKPELHRSAIVPADARARTMNALTDALEEIMIELGGGIHA